MAASIEQTRDDRDGTEDDRVEANDWNEEEHRPPPVIGRDLHGQRMRHVCCACTGRTRGRPFSSFSRSTTGGETTCAARPGSMWRPKIILPAVVCSTLVTTMSIVLLIIFRALSTTTIVPSSR